VVRAACERFGLQLDVIGFANGNRTATPETVLPSYDVVFARGRAAIEALAVGAAVVLCDIEGSGPLVTTGDLDRLRSLNFAIGTFTGPCTAEALLEQLMRYDPVDAAQVSRRIREQAGLEPVVDRLLAIYANALEVFRSAPTPTIREERQAIIRHARWLSSFMLQQGHTQDRSETLQLIQRIATERHAIERERETYARDREAFVRTLEAYQRERAAYLGEQRQ